MPSPFPGMDPYLESPSYWKGFHTTFLVYLRKSLRSRLPDGYYAEVEQHIWLESDAPEGRRPFAYPDAFVTTVPKARGPRTAVAELTATAATLEATFTKPAKKKSSKYVTIVDAAKNRVVTVIELLSPSNKSSGPDRRGYLAKREEYILSGTNLVEVDLLRAGKRLQMGRTQIPLADYYAFVSRAAEFPGVDIWAFTVREPLPILPIPLKPEHDDIPVSLRECLDGAYEDADYEARIEYDKPPDIPLRKPDADWAEQRLAGNT